ncbi:hypothetical protein ACFPYI_20675 [Halomarina salina]|uniref:Uncharacterized protein n=1 Tax=Halomarina salina TaxID=1872699 RepID=A0ABD5RTF6_9EURY|nr:hypothetical protein [Halomarina salina]
MEVGEQADGLIEGFIPTVLCSGVGFRRVQECLERRAAFIVDDEVVVVEEGALAELEVVVTPVRPEVGEFDLVFLAVVFVVETNESPVGIAGDDTPDVARPVGDEYFGVRSDLGDSEVHGHRLEIEFAIFGVWVAGATIQSVLARSFHVNIGSCLDAVGGRRFIVIVRLEVRFVKHAAGIRVVDAELSFVAVVDVLAAEGEDEPPGVG